MRILLNECVDARLRRLLRDHAVQTVTEAGWRTLEDRPLLVAAQGRIDVFVTIGKGIEHEQNWRGLGFAIVVIHVPRNEIEYYEPLAMELRKAIESAQREA